MYEELFNLTTNFIVLFRKNVKKYNISLSQGLILLAIGPQRKSMTYLSKKLGLDPSTMTRNISKLEKKHLVYRERSEEDSRTIFVQQSNKGKEIAGQLEKDIESELHFSLNNRIQIKDNIHQISWFLEKVNNK